VRDGRSAVACKSLIRGIVIVIGHNWRNIRITAVQPEGCWFESSPRSHFHQLSGIESVINFAAEASGANRSVRALQVAMHQYIAQG